MTDHHRHPLELVLAEAPAIEIVVVIAHAMHFQLLLFLSHQQVEELEGNPVGSPGEPGGPRGAGSAREVSGGSRGTAGSSRKVNLGGDGELVSSPPSFSDVISRS